VQHILVCMCNCIVQDQLMSSWILRRKLGSRFSPTYALMQMVLQHTRALFGRWKESKEYLKLPAWLTRQLN